MLHDIVSELLLNEMQQSVCMHCLHVPVMLLFLRQQLQWLGHEQRVELVSLASIAIQPMLMK